MTNIKAPQNFLNEVVVEVFTAATLAISGFLTLLVFAV